MNTLLRLAFVGAALASSALSLPAIAQTTPQTAAPQAVAASEPATLFPSLVAEARSKTPAPTEVGTINTNLATAEWHWAKGERARAVSYLNFVEGELGLRLVPVEPATQQAGRPAAIQ